MSSSLSLNPNQSITTDTVYTGLATFGRIRVIIMTVILSLISMALLIGGVYMTISKKNYASATAVLSNVQCSPPNSQGQINCNFTVTYTVDGKTFSKSISQMNSNPLTDGSVIDIFYNPQNPSEIYIGDYAPSKTGWILIISAIALGLLTALIYFLTMKYKPFAAVEGAAGVVDLLRR